MNLEELGRLLRDFAPYATLVAVVLAGWRLFMRINETKSKLTELGKDLESVNSLFLQIRLDAEKVGRSRPEAVQGLVHYSKWDTDLIRSLMRGAKERIWILQTWFPEMEADIHQWCFDHTKQLNVRILMAGKSNPAINERARFRDDFINDTTDADRIEHIALIVSSCEAMIRKKLDEHHIKGEFSRYEQGMPFGPIYIVDDIAVFGIYPPRKNCNFAPMMRVPVSSDTGKLLIESFETFWLSANGTREASD